MTSLRLPSPLCGALLLLSACAASAQDSASASALRFFGTGSLLTDRVTIPIDDNDTGNDRSTPADIGAGSFTIEFWVRGELADNTAAAQAAGSHPANTWINGNIVLDRDIWPQGGGTGDRDFGISFADGRLMFGTGQNGADPAPDGENTLVGSRNVLDGNWHHVAVVRNTHDGSKTIYLDGEIDTTVNGVSDDDLSYPNDGVPINASSNCDCNNFLVLGAEKHDAGPAFPSFNGYFDELRLWRAALSRDCIRHYRHRVLVNPAAGRGPVDGFPDLVASYRFEEGSGVATSDSSGATRDGRSNLNGSVVDGTPGKAEWVSAADDPNNTAPVWEGTDIGGPISGKVIVSGLTRPLFVCSPPGDSGRLFIVEQRDNSAVGHVKIFNKAAGRLNPRDFLAIPNVRTSNEEGLLGFAFHPDYATNGFVYVYFSRGSNSTRETVVQRFQASHLFPGGLDNPEQVDPASETTIIRIRQPFDNHNGGWMGFREGDAGSYLHISTGDGGSGNDPRNSGQSTTDNPSTNDAHEGRLGKILRIDVDGDDFPGDDDRNYAIPPANRFASAPGDDEIWLYGLRNPWRCSFDRLTGDFWIADVGQAEREEINFRAAESPDDAAGNYGWRLREGFIPTPGVGGNPPIDNVEPILDYTQPQAEADTVLNGLLFGRSITGGYVYRGPQAGLHGTYFFGDARSDRLWSLRYCNGAVTELTERTAELIPAGVGNPEITSFGEDAEGNLYYCSRNGNIVQILIEDPWHSWRNEHFTADQLANDVLSGPLGNPDRDPRSNLEEFVVNSDPLATDGDLPVLLASTIVGPDEFFTFSLARDPRAFGVVTLTGETTGDLDLFAPVDPAEILTDTETLFEFRDSVPMSNARFRAGRLRFELE